MTLALPSAAAPVPKRQAMVAVGVLSVAAITLMGGMLSVWLRFRAAAPTRESSDGLYTIKDWLPKDITIPEVAANTMLVTFFALLLMAQWASYSAKRGHDSHRSLALLVTFGLGAAIVNAQIAVYSQMGIGVRDGAYQSMFYAITATMLILVVVGMAFTAVAWFRSVGGRRDDVEVVNAHALYWYVLTGIFVALWFVVYVQK
ncbi:MAG: cytochrome c oxidase subunit 3 [Ilumatobacteraceae bacterium]|jgi:heme/copper-type cytochrome/quinol oxidase subunit 3|nr:cytochrome c oxidase subunit 3 [Ilumatobacteraceae bacterium]